MGKLFLTFSIFLGTFDLSLAKDLILPPPTPAYTSPVMEQKNLERRTIDDHESPQESMSEEFNKKIRKEISSKKKILEYLISLSG